jgi:uncharacterized protein
VRRSLLFVLMTALLVLTGCGRGVRNNTQARQNDGDCVKRADVKLLVAALKRDTATMQAALNSGADANAIVEGLGPPIVVASLDDKNSGVQLLLDRGANINAEDSEGYTALINASFTNNPKMVQLLLSRGVNVNAPSNLMVNGKQAGFTALMIAKSKGREEIVKLLTEAGAKE